MGPEIPISFKYVLLIQAVLMVHAAAPDYSPNPWNVLIRIWRSNREKRLLKRRQRFAAKNKRYWEIDIKNLR